MLVYIIAAITLDGFIGKSADHRSTEWTSPEDKKFFINRTKQSGAILMGSTTYNTIGRPLPGRLNLIYTNHPEKYPSDNPQLLRTTNLPPKELVHQLQATGYKELAICGGGTIYSLFMAAGVVDKLYLTVEPVLFGQGIPLFSQPLNQKLKLAKLDHLSSQTLLLEYDVEK